MQARNAGSHCFGAMQSLFERHSLQRNTAGSHSGRVAGQSASFAHSSHLPIAVWQMCRCGSGHCALLVHRTQIERAVSHVEPGLHCPVEVQLGTQRRTESTQVSG